MDADVLDDPDRYGSSGPATPRGITCTVIWVVSRSRRGLGVFDGVGHHEHLGILTGQV
ncbi:hypothetical protein ACXYX3_00190 [Mycobacterium sp. C3-094]